MSGLVSLILLLSSWQYVCGQQKCSTTDSCKPVKADICDNSKCLVVDQLEIPQITKKGATIHDWNILPPPFTNGCPIKYEPIILTNYVLNMTVTAYTGDNCDNEVSTSSELRSDIDLSSGKLRLLSGDRDVFTIEACFLYIERGVGFVYRGCIANSTDPCAVIYSVEVTSEETVGDKIHDFLDGLGVDMQNNIIECVP